LYMAQNTLNAACERAAELLAWPINHVLL
jgi:hypothetical protein